MRKQMDAREIAFALGIGMIAALIAAIVGLATATAWLGVVVFAGLAALLLWFWYLTRDRLPPSHAQGQQVYWRPHGWEPRKVKIIRVEPGEPGHPEYVFVELDEGDVRTASTADLTVPYLTRLKYSWRR